MPTDFFRQCYLYTLKQQVPLWSYPNIHWIECTFIRLTYIKQGICQMSSNHSRHCILYINRINQNEQQHSWMFLLVLLRTSLSITCQSHGTLWDNDCYARLTGKSYMWAMWPNCVQALVAMGDSVVGYLWGRISLYKVLSLSSISIFILYIYQR